MCLRVLAEIQSVSRPRHLFASVSLPRTSLWPFLNTLSATISMPASDSSPQERCLQTATSSISHTTAVVPYPVVTDLTVYFFSTDSPSTCKLDPGIWHRIEKDLYLYTS
ncbi:hypothetical protein BX600DRAFT_469737 [Xylariales sp. PMI_506]|nr:hypothetical protein BX600DRAFT_469737 [Xylariales sp. PMI_506]